MPYRTSSSTATALREVRVQIDDWKCSSCGHTTARLHGVPGNFWLDCAGCDSPAMILADRCANLIASIAQQPRGTRHDPAARLAGPFRIIARLNPGASRDHAGAAGIARGRSHD
jgi:hypothetical protein